MKKNLVKFSKKYNILELKKDFFSENKLNLKNAIALNKLYLRCPKRKVCKNCQKKIENFIFKSFGVKYSICSRCGHLNGERLENEIFFKKLYTKGTGQKNIEKNYKKSFDQKVKKIYLSKAKFLKKVIKKKIHVLDIGSGGGHFLKALELLNIPARGYEPNKFLSNLGQKKLKSNYLFNESFTNVNEKILSEKKANSLSMIGVLEHVDKPEMFMNTFKKSNMKYLYISVPLFSINSIFENSFSQIYPRHLSGGHTHLYTKKSLYFLANKFNLKIIGEWWFGTDIADLYRSLLVSSKSLDKVKYKRIVDDNLYSVLDEIQNIFDKKKICSEVHMIFKK